MKTNQHPTRGECVRRLVNFRVNDYAFLVLEAQKSKRDATSELDVMFDELRRLRKPERTKTVHVK